MTSNFKKYDFMVFIGRMQPMTIAHLSVINMARQMADKVIVLIGSAGEARTIKNPFSYDERAEWVHRAVGRDNENVIICPIFDFPYNDNKWMAGVQKTVAEITNKVENAKIGIIGYYKDQSSFYLTELFPKWTTVPVKPYSLHNGNVINATEARAAYLEGRAVYCSDENDIKSLCPDVEDAFGVSEYVKLNVHEDILYMLENDPSFADVIATQKMLPGYRKIWGAGPFITGDAVVVQNGHVLLIKRKDIPGKGLWALPGGFINNNERIKDGIIRELEEETKVKVPVEVLKRNIKHIHVFDNPDRDVRGRVVTHAAFIDLGNFQKLPHVKGSDDAEKAKWVAFSDLKRDMFFADHYHVIDFFINFD